MKWNKFRLKTTTQAEDIVSSMLMELGIQGVEIEDKIPLSQSDKEQMFVDILPETEPDDGVAYLSFYLEEDDDKDSILSQVRQELKDMSAYVDVGECLIEESQTEDVDWVNNWKQYFHQFYVDDILIIPSWEEVKPEDSEKMVIHIDPGTAFGTGMHETTQLCIRQIRKYVKPDTRILDVGCGSGILAITAALLGANKIIGCDIDEVAVKVAGENAALNGVQDRIAFHQGDLTSQVEGSFQIICANIVADVIIRLSEDAGRYLAKDGIFITSGIIDTREQDVLNALEQNGFQVIERRTSGGWVALACKAKVQ